MRKILFPESHLNRLLKNSKIKRTTPFIKQTHTSSLRATWNEESKAALKYRKIYVWEWNWGRQDLTKANIGNALAFNIEILKCEINRLLKNGIREPEEIKNKIKKTYKNRYFMIINK